MTPAELNKLVERRQEEVLSLCKFWHSLFPQYSPGASQMRVWLDLHDFDRVVNAIRKTAAKNAKLGGAMDLEYATKFCSKVANVAKSKQEEQAG